FPDVPVRRAQILRSRAGDGFYDARAFVDVVQYPLLAVTPFHLAEGAVAVGVVLDFVPSTVLLLGGLSAGDAPVNFPAPVVGVLRKPPAHHKEGRLDALPVQQIEQTGRRDACSRLRAQQHVGLGTVVESKRNKLLTGRVWRRLARRDVGEVGNRQGKKQAGRLRSQGKRQAERTNATA